MASAAASGGAEAGKSKSGSARGSAKGAAPPAAPAASGATGGGDLLSNLKLELYKPENGLAVKLLERAEKVSKVEREKLVAGLGGILALYLVVGHFAELVCNLGGFLYPAHRSFKSEKSEAEGGGTGWLVCWTVFATFSLVDFAAEAILSWFPVYWVAKLAFLVYLWCPLTRGAQRLYKNQLEPAFDRFGPIIAEYINRLNN